MKKIILTYKFLLKFYFWQQGKLNQVIYAFVFYYNLGLKEILNDTYGYIFTTK